MNLNELAAEAHKTAVAHGWWEADDVNFGMLLALIHSEVSEVLEDFRRGRSMTKISYLVDYNLDDLTKTAKPEGIPIEFADIIIRVLDLCAGFKIDIDEAVNLKMEYNKGRPYKHGNLLA